MKPSETESPSWLVGMLARMQAELDPSGLIFQNGSAEILSRAALSSGIVLVHDARGCTRAGPTWQPTEVRAVLCARPEELPLRKKSRLLFVDAAFTEVPYRRQGRMAALVDGLIAYCRTNAMDGVALGVLEHSPAARAFWTARGFRAVSTRFELPME